MPDRWVDRDTTFAGMLQNLLDSAAAASEAKSMGEAARTLLLCSGLLIVTLACILELPSEAWL